MNWYDMPLRDYDPAIARWTGIDPVTHHSQSTYNAFDGNPVFWADPSGADAVTFTKGSDGEFRMTSYKTDEEFLEDLNRFASFDYLNYVAEGNVDGSGNPPTGKSISKFPVIVNMDGTINQSLGTAIAISKMDGPFKFADVAAGTYVLHSILGIAVAHVIAKQLNDAQSAVLLAYDANWLYSKQSKEIERILTKDGGPPGMTYALLVNTAGTYIDVRGNAVSLEAGDVWKYGQTTKGFDRYSRTELSTMVPGGVRQVPLFLGNQVEIRVQEKIMIYGHTLATGSLPPGNNIFR